MEDSGGMIITAENSLFVQHSHLVTNQEALDKGDNEFSLRNICVNTSKLYLHARLYFPSEVSRAADFYRPQKSNASAGFEAANQESNGKHANYYTTEAT
jgi:hypothetical protein